MLLCRVSREFPTSVTFSPGTSIPQKPTVLLPYYIWEIFYNVRCTLALRWKYTSYRAFTHFCNNERTCSYIMISLIKLLTCTGTPSISIYVKRKLLWNDKMALDDRSRVLNTMIRHTHQIHVGFNNTVIYILFIRSVTIHFLPSRINLLYIINVQYIINNLKYKTSLLLFLRFNNQHLISKIITMQLKILS